MTKKPVLLDKTKIYSITSIVLDSNSILLGNGSTLLFDGSGADGGIVIENNKENIYIENCILKAKNIDKKNGRGINITKSKNIKIYNCHIDGQAVDENGNFRTWVENNSINGYGSYNGISIQYSKYITIDNCSIKNIWSQGLASSYSEHIIISHNHIENTGRGGIYVMGGNNNVEISGNTLINCVKYFTVADAAIDVYGEPVSAEELQNPDRKGLPNYALRIVNNYIKGFGSEIEPGCGILIKGAYGAVCENNTIISDEDTHPLAGIMLQDRNRTEVKDCIVNNNTVYIEKCYREAESEEESDKPDIQTSEFAHLIRIFDTISSKDVIISNNILKTNQRGINGITLRGNSENIVIENNIIETIRYGIQSKNSVQKKLKITNNTIRGCVSLTECEEVSINNNDIYLCVDSPYAKHGAFYISNSKDINYKYNRLKNKSDEAVFEFFENCDEDTIDIQDNIYYNADGTLTNQRVIRQSFMTAISTAKPNTTIILLNDNYNTLISLTGDKNHGKRLDTTGAKYYQNSVKFPENLTLKGALANAGIVLKEGISISSGVTSEESYQSSNIQDAILPKGLTIDNITFQKDIGVRNCQMEGLKITNCVFGKNATIQLDPQRFVNMYGKDYGDSKPSDTRYGVHKLRLINPIIQNCTFQNTGMSKTSDLCSIYARCVDGIIVQNNKITGSKGDGIQITGFSGTIGAKGGCRSCGKIIIGNNTITNIYKRGIRLSYLENADIELLYNALSNVCKNNDPDHIKANYFSGYNNKFTQTGNTVDDSINNLIITVEELKQIDDYITEHSDTSNLHYRKWNNGLAEVYGLYELTSDDKGIGYLNEEITLPFDINCNYIIASSNDFATLASDCIGGNKIFLQAKDTNTNNLLVSLHVFGDMSM